MDALHHAHNGRRAGKAALDFIRGAGFGVTKARLDAAMVSMGFNAPRWGNYASHYRAVYGSSPPDDEQRGADHEETPGVCLPPQGQDRALTVVARRGQDDPSARADFLAVAVLAARLGPERVRELLELYEEHERWASTGTG